MLDLCFEQSIINEAPDPAPDPIEPAAARSFRNRLPGIPQNRIGCFFRLMTYANLPFLFIKYGPADDREIGED